MLGKERPDGLYVPTGMLMAANGKRIAGLALKSRLPSVYDNKEAVDAGGLMYYGVSHISSIKFSKALSADLPVEQPMKFEFIINLKAAKQIGLTIPPNVLARADKVIK